MDSRLRGCAVSVSLDGVAALLVDHDQNAERPPRSLRTTCDRVFAFYCSCWLPSLKRSLATTLPMKASLRSAIPVYEQASVVDERHTRTHRGPVNGCDFDILLWSTGPDGSIFSPDTYVLLVFK